MTFSTGMERRTTDSARGPTVRRVCISHPISGLQEGSGLILHRPRSQHSNTEVNDPKRPRGEHGRAMSVLMVPPLGGRWQGWGWGRNWDPSLADPTWLSFLTMILQDGGAREQPIGLVSFPFQILTKLWATTWVSHGEGRPIYLINTSPCRWNLPSSHRGTQEGASVTLITSGLLQHEALRNSFSTLINKSIKKMFDIISPENRRKKKHELETPIIFCCLVSDDR